MNLATNCVKTNDWCLCYIAILETVCKNIAILETMCKKK